MFFIKKNIYTLLFITECSILVTNVTLHQISMYLRFKKSPATYFGAHIQSNGIKTKYNHKLCPSLRSTVIAWWHGMALRCVVVVVVVEQT